MILGIDVSHKLPQVIPLLERTPREEVISEETQELSVLREQRFLGQSQKV